MNVIYSGHPIVDKIAEINFSGNIKPVAWNKTVVTESGRPDRLAQDILSELCWRYRPQEIRIGSTVTFKKKFNDKLYYTNYAHLCDYFGENRKAIVRAFVNLERLGLVKRHIEDLISSESKVKTRRFYIEIFPEAIKKATYPDPDGYLSDSEDEDEFSQENYETLASYTSEEWTQVSRKELPYSQTGENNDESAGQRVWTNRGRPLDKADETALDELQTASEDTFADDENIATPSTCDDSEKRRSKGLDKSGEGSGQNGGTIKNKYKDLKRLDSSLKTLNQGFEKPDLTLKTFFPMQASSKETITGEGAAAPDAAL